MARVQTSKNNSKNKNKNNSNTSQKNAGSKKNNIKKDNPKREPTKNEMMFYRIGMGVITITLIVLAIVLVIQYSKTDDVVVPYEDNIQITTNDLKYITQEDEYGVYGNFSYFDGQDDYADLRSVLNSNNFVYMYFYRSTDINEDIQAVIDSLSNIDSMAFLFFDLDGYSNTTVFDTAELNHLYLDSTKDNMFLIFDINAQTFQLETRVSDILIELNKF